MSEARDGMRMSSTCNSARLTAALVVVSAVASAAFVGRGHADVEHATAVSGTNGAIALTSDRGIDVIRPDGSRLRGIAAGFAPAWSPDGKRLIYSERTPGPCAPCSFRLNILELPSGKRTPVLEGQTFDPAPAWSPDGRLIAYTHQPRGEIDDEIWVANTDGTDKRQLTSGIQSYHPAWSPDGTRVAFAGAQGGSIDIFVVSATGGAPVRVSARSGVDVRPAWSPDGSKIAYVSDRAGFFEVFAMNADGSNPRQLTTGASRVECSRGCTLPLINPSWSPDGTQIVYGADRDGDLELYVMNADGSGQKRLTDSPGTDVDPDWQSTVALALRKGSSRATVRVGQKLTYSVTVRNIGARVATAVGVVATRSGASSAVVTALSSAGSCRRGARVTCSVGDLRPGATARISVTYRPRKRGTLRAAFTVSAAEADANGRDDQIAFRTVARPSKRR